MVCPSKAADKKFHRTLNLPGVRLDVGVDDSVRHGAARGVCVEGVWCWSRCVVVGDGESDDEERDVEEELLRRPNVVRGEVERSG